MSTEKTTFMECLWHESKKAYPTYILYASIVIDIIALISIISWSLFTGRILLTNGFSTFCEFYMRVSGAINDGVYSILVSPPWWVYLLLLILSPPFIWAVSVCIKRRYNIEVISVILAILLFYWLIGIFILGIFSILNLHGVTLTTIIIGSMFMYRWVTGLNNFGKHAWEVDSRKEDKVETEEMLSHLVGEELDKQNERLNKMYKEGRKG